jgi:hypothetical protein
MASLLNSTHTEFPTLGGLYGFPQQQADDFCEDSGGERILTRITDLDNP